MVRTLLCVGLVLIFACPTSAAVFVYICPETEPCPASDGAGTIVSSVQRYNTNTEVYEWIVTFEPNNGKTPDALWFVVSDGPEPEATNEVAILYADRATGRVSAYVYDSSLNEDSWQIPTAFIETFPNAMTVTNNVDGTVVFDLTIDATNINSFSSLPGWKGLRFGETIGFWNAGLADAEIVFDADGRIQSFTFGARSSYDRTDRSTVEIPLAVRATAWSQLKLLYDE